MHKDAVIVVNLLEEHTDDTILTVLNNGLRSEFKYYDYSWGEKYFESQRLNIEKALLRVKRKDDESPVLCKFQDTSFYFNFYKNEDRTCSISLWSASYPWKKEFWNGEEGVELDLQRYIRLMMQLLEGFHIKKLEAKIEWE